MTQPQPLRIAVLINGFTSPSTPGIRASFTTAITAAAAPTATPRVTFYDPIIAQAHPDPSAYDLIVLSGGTADPMGSDPWVLNLQSYLRRTVSSHPHVKLVGICWGHQTLQVSLGGAVATMPAPEVGVKTLALTEPGRRVFPFATAGEVRLHEFHRRAVVRSGEGFVVLAEGNQVFVNEANTILTFQGHPELDATLAKTLLKGASPYMGIVDAKRAGLAREMEKGHDGVEVWRRILDWVKE